MPTKSATIVGDALWLGITGLVLAVIMGIVSWPLSTELSLRIHAGGASASPTIGVAPEAGAGSAPVPPSPTFGINRIPALGASSTKADEVAEGSSGVVPTTSIVAPTEPAGVKSPLRDSIADQLANQPLVDHGGLGPAARGPQPPQSVLASPSAHSLGPHRPREHHQRARPPAPGANAQLVPW